MKKKNLMNKIPSRRGSAVYVNGTTYAIDQRSVCRDVDPVDADKLLGADEWVELSPERLAQIDASPAPRATPSNVERKARKTVIHPNRPVVIPEPEVEAVEVGMPHPAEQDEPNVERDAEDLGKSDAEVASEVASEVAPEPESVGAQGPPPPSTAEPKYDPDHIPSGEEDDPWPDPDPGMSKSYLQEMARAYEVDFVDKDSRRVLCTKIVEKMYPDGSGNED